MSIIGGSLTGQRPLINRPTGGGDSGHGLRRQQSAASAKSLGMGSTKMPPGSLALPRAASSASSPPASQQTPLVPVSSPTWSSPWSAPRQMESPVKGSPMPGYRARPSSPVSPMGVLAALPAGNLTTLMPQAVPVPAPLVQAAPRYNGENVPPPDVIQKKKDESSKALESQLKEGADQLGSKHKEKTDYLHALANQQKQQFNIMLEQQVKEQEMFLMQEYNGQLMRLQQAAQAHKATLETQANMLATTWQQRKVQEEFERQKVGIEAQYLEAQTHISDEIEKLGATPAEVAFVATRAKTFSQASNTSRSGSYQVMRQASMPSSAQPRSLQPPRGPLAASAMIPSLRAPSPIGPPTTLVLNKPGGLSSAAPASPPVVAYHPPTVNNAKVPDPVPVPAAVPETRLPYVPPPGLNPAMKKSQSYTNMPLGSARSLSARSNNRSPRPTRASYAHVGSPLASYVGAPIYSNMPGSVGPPPGVTRMSTAPGQRSMPQSPMLPSRSFVPPVQMCPGRSRSPSPNPDRLNTSRSTTSLPGSHLAPVLQGIRSP